MNELHRIDSTIFELIDMPVCFRTQLYKYKNRGWTYATAFIFM